MAAAGRPRSRTLVFSAVCDTCVVLLLLVQIAFAFLASQLMKRLSVGRICSHTAQRHHAFFRLGPFVLSSDLITNQPARKKIETDCAERRSLDDNFPDDSSRTMQGRTRSLLSASASPSSQSISSSSVVECNLLDHRPEFPFRGISAGASLVYRRAGNDIRSSKDCTDCSSNESEIKPIPPEVSEDKSLDLVLLNQRSIVGWSSSTALSDMNGAIAEDSRGCFFWQGHNCDLVLRLLQALQSEHEKLCSVYAELEEERVAAETATNEAMSMILRLQEQKSALQLEAAHDRRMAEEKALHDEQAIQLLEEALSVKENERLLLEEQLEKMKSKSAHRQKEMVPGSAPASFSNVNKQTPLSELQRNFSLEMQQRTRSACSEEAIVEEVDSENFYVRSISAKISALEKRLEALSAGESRDLNLVPTKSKLLVGNNAEGDAGVEGVPSAEAKCSGCIGEQEKVVNIDVANKNYQTLKDMCYVHDAEDAEEKEQCDIPYPITQGNLQTAKHQLLLSLSHPTSDAAPQGVNEAMNWITKKVTLENMELRLQILEKQILLLMQQAVPRHHEHLNMALLKQILKGLDALLPRAYPTQRYIDASLVSLQSCVAE